MHREDALFGEPLSVPPYVPPPWYLKLDINEPLFNSYSKCFESEIVKYKLKITNGLNISETLLK